VQNRRLIILALIAGAIVAFALGAVSGRNLARPPVVTVALDLMGEVTRLRTEADKLEASVAERTGRIAALEGEIAGLKQGSGSALAAREAELVAARKRIAALTEREAELEQAARRNVELSAKAEGLRQARDRARKASAALEQHKTDLRAALQTNAEMAAKMEGLRRARDEAGEASAQHARTIALLRRDLSEMTGKHDSRMQELNAEISTLREKIEGKDKEIARLQDSLRESRTRPQPAADVPRTGPAPVAALPPAPAGADTAAPPTRLGVLDGAAAYRAADYAKAYEIWRPLAESGNIRAQFHIGALYYEGRGVAKDLDSAYFWLGRAAARGSEPAQALLHRLEEERRAAGPSEPKSP